MKKHLCFQFGLALFVLGAGAVNAGAVSYFDGTFNDSDWSIDFMTDSAGSTAARSQVATGGNPDFYQSEVYNFTGAGGVRAEYLRAGVLALRDHGHA